MQSPWGGNPDTHYRLFSDGENALSREGFLGMIRKLEGLPVSRYWNTQRSPGELSSYPLQYPWASDTSVFSPSVPTSKEVIDLLPISFLLGLTSPLAVSLASLFFSQQLSRLGDLEEDAE